MSYLYFNQNCQELISNESKPLFFKTQEETLNAIEGVSKLNILVGANNSGKSRLMRGILKSDTYTHESIDISTVTLSIISSFKKIAGLSHSGEVLINHRFTERQGLLSKIKFESVKTFADTSAMFFEEILINAHNIQDRDREGVVMLFEFVTLLSEVWEPYHDTSSSNRKMYVKIAVKNGVANLFDWIFKKEKALWSDLIISLEKFCSSNFKRENPKGKIFIPSLRTIHTLHSSNGNNFKSIHSYDHDIFRDTIFKNYGFNYELHLEKQKISIHSGLSMYSQIDKTKKGHDPEKDGFIEFEQFILKNFFPNSQTLEIFSKHFEISNEDGGGSINIRIDKDPSKPIHFLGDGIQTLINLLYPIFVSEKDTWFFIEEPEIHLHPGLQRVFMEVLLTNEYVLSKNLRFFFTTHSNHILDIAALSHEVSIYSLKKVAENKHIVRNVKAGDISILDELGVQNSSVYLANCTIWVEGPTDRLYILKYLQCYLDHLDETDKKHAVFHEDLEFAFYLYGGSNIVQFYFGGESELDDEQKEELSKIESKFLSNRILLFADSDKGKAKAKRHTKLEGLSNDIFSYKRIPVREIENLLSKKFLLSNLHKIVTSVKEEEIQKLIIDEKKLKKEYLGSYLVSLANRQKITFPKSFKGKSGTVNSTTYKRKLAEVAYENMTWDLMTNEAKAIAKRVYEFIAKHNGKS